MDLEKISIVFGLLAGAVQLIGYIVYNYGAGEKINTGSWSIWAIGGAIDFASFFVLTEGDWVVSFLPAICGLAAFCTFLYAIIRKRFSWPDRTDWAFVGADGLITAIWYFTNVVIANLLYQISTVASFIPLCRGLLTGKEKEKLFPWLIWSLAYSLLTVSVLQRVEKWNELVQLAYPISHVAVHLIVVAIIIVQLQKSAR